MPASLGVRLEQYTLQHLDEVLLVRLDVDGTPDEVVIFKGFSSSLMRPTAFDPDVPTIPETATIKTVDRLRGPYQPASPEYLERHISWSDFSDRLTAAGL